MSYPKKMPPKLAKAHIRYALKVTGASIRLTSAVAERPAGILAYFDVESK
jgi:hypothetical protein